MLTEVLFLPSSRRLIALDNTGLLSIRETMKQKPAVQPFPEDFITAVTFSPSGMWLIVAVKDKGVRYMAWNEEGPGSLIGHEVLFVRTTILATVVGMAVTADLRHLGVTPVEQGGKRTFRLIAISFESSARVRFTHSLLAGEICNRVVFSTCGQYYFYTKSDDLLICREVDTNVQTVWTIESTPRDLAYKADLGGFAVATDTCYIIPGNGYRERITRDDMGSKLLCFATANKADGSLVSDAVASEEGILVILASGKRRMFRQRAVRCMAPSADGSMLVAVSASGLLKDYKI